MPFCPSGISAPLPGVPSAVVVDQAYMQSLIPAPWSWLYPYLPYVHALEIGDVGAFCAADPPTFTLPSAADFFQFVTGGPIGQFDAVDTFIRNVVQAYLWQRLCHCTTSTTPGPPSAVGPPADLPALNPPTVVGPPTGSACLTFSTQTFGGTGSSGVNMPDAPFLAPSGVTSVDITAFNTSTSADHVNAQLRGWTAPARGGTLSVNTTIGLNIPHGTSVLLHQAITNPSLYWDFVLTDNTVGEVYQGNGLFNFYCGGAIAGQPVAPCCPPDPILTGLLNQILNLVTLIQRQNVPFAYVSGTTHSGLTGTGTLSVSGILGLLANASVPASTSDLGGTPDVRLPIGRVNFATADGYEDRHELVTDSQLIFPVNAGLYTTVGYSLRPGVTLALTELRREP